ncbi:MAG: SDR family oxidoreductase [Sediminibacterium sp.]|nr:SDR family oxidoreductase [Sediminibacterium sp.]
MKLLITGGAGYVGSVLSNLALQKGFQVKAVDWLWFNEQIPLQNYSNPNYEFIKGDICDKNFTATLFQGVDFVIHTAAVVGDPASKLFPELTTKINYDASLHLIEQAKQNQIKGFVFLSTCSNYGVANDLATEDTPLNPLSLYASSKVDTETYLMEKSGDLNWVIGRLSTVYGLSPRMRFDLTVNDFTLCGFKDKKIDIFLPESYRPYIHTFDLSNILLTLVNQFDKVKNNVFNIGFEGENYQKIQIANAVKALMPETAINILREGGDKRDYQVSFAKLHRFIDVKQYFNVEKSVKEIHEALSNGLIPHPEEKVYYNTSPRF